MDNIIQPTIILLILSLITEKIANLVKLQFENLSSRHNGSLDEKTREKKIQNVSILTGVGVALIAKANFFKLFQEDYEMTWSHIDLINGLFITIVGCIISGFFLSLGSKFFHDLLDILLQAKNLKRKINERKDWEFESIEEVDQYLKSNDAQQLKNQLDTILMIIPGVYYYESDYDKLLVRVYVKPGTTGIPAKIPVKTSYGKNKLLGVEIIEELTEIRALSIVGPSDEISNATAYRNSLSGSVGYPVKRASDGKIFLLTCYHAVWNEGHDWDVFIPIGKELVVDPKTGARIGHIRSAYKNFTLDVALIEPDIEVTVTDDIPFLNHPKPPRIIDQQDKAKRTAVKIKSPFKTNAVNNGYVSEVNVTANIKYPDGISRNIDGLIKISSYGNSPFSVGGDSGSFILDEWDYAIGIVVAGNERDTTFAIPLTTIFNNLNLKIQ